MNHLITIIVPVYNTSAYLDACMQSILRQSYTHLEILLINDGSTDDSLSICRRYEAADPRVRVIDQENRGLSGVRNVGVAAATGDYVTFVDSDDEITDNAIELLYGDVIAHDADIASAVKAAVRADGQINNSFADGELSLYKGTDMLRLSLAGHRQTGSVCAKLFRRSFLDGLTFPEGRTSMEDGFFLFQCYTRCPVTVQHNVCTYYYYVRGNSLSRGKFSDRFLNILYFCEQKKQIIAAQFPELTDEMRNQEVMAHIAFLNVLIRTTDPAYRQMEKDSIRFVRRNSRHFHSLNAHMVKMDRIIKWGLYPLYKILFRRKFRA